jgi:hypothetical protein
MKAYTIAIFLLLFQLSAFFIDKSEVFPSEKFPVDNSSYYAWESTARGFGITTAGEASADQNAELMQSKGGFGSLFKILDVTSTFQNLGIPSDIAVALSIPVYFIWIFAFVQFIRGGSFANQA